MSFDERWFQQEPIAGVAFLLNEAVQVVSGPHAGQHGSTVALLALEPEPRYTVELATGQDVRLSEPELRSAHLQETTGVLSALQHWYARHTDGDWEHRFGIRIETLDNPGWLVSISLRDTELADRPFAEVAELEPERDWMRCWVQEGHYEARGGLFMLERMLRTFSEWAGCPGPAPRA